MANKAPKVDKFISDITKEANKFSIGSPWRNSDLSVTCVVPVIRANKDKPDYLLLSQARDVDISDTGAIDRVRIKNNEKQPIFIRMGELLKGKTQERSVVISRVIMSGKEEIVDVKCIHASRPIHSGAKFSSGGIAPMRDSLYSSTSLRGMSVNQATSWSNDSNYVRSVNCLLSGEELC